MKKSIAVLTSGGDAPGMNAALRAVVRSGIGSGFDVYAVYRGFEGLLRNDFVQMDSLSVANILSRGGTIIYTARCPEFMTKEGVKKAADILRSRKIEDLIVIGGDGSFRGALELSKCGIGVICIPGTIDLDLGCTDYTIGFDTAANTAMEAIDKVRDTSSSHERCSVIEVMGRNSGYIALWTGIATGAEEILIPETSDYNIETLITRIKIARKKGKNQYIIVNSEGIGHSSKLAQDIEAITGIETRATVLGYMQRGGSPTVKDRVYASIMGREAVGCIENNKKNRAIVHMHGKFLDMDLQEALSKEKTVEDLYYNVATQIIR